MSVYRIAAVVLRQLYLLRNSPARWLPLFVWATVDIVLWGFITRYLNTIASSGFDFIPMLLGAVLFWDFFTRVMNGVAIAFLEDVWSRNFLNFFTSPLTIAEYLTGLIFTSITTSLVGLTVMLFLARAVFGLSWFVYGAAFVPFLLVLFLFGIGMGIFGSAVVFRLGPASEWLIWPIPAILSPFAGVFYPLATLPHWMHGISYLLPASYIFKGMRKIVAGGTQEASVEWSSLLLATGLSVAYILLACWFFSRIYRHATRSGLIARYSAETVP